MYRKTVEAELEKLLKLDSCEAQGYGVYRVPLTGGGSFVVEFHDASNKFKFDGWISIQYIFGEKDLFALCYHSQNDNAVGEKRFWIAEHLSSLIGRFGFIGAAGFQLSSTDDEDSTIGKDFCLSKTLNDPDNLFANMRLAVLLADNFIAELLAELKKQKLGGKSIGPSSAKVTALIGS